MSEVASGWVADVDRDRDWLFVRVRVADSQNGNLHGFAESIWSLLQQHFMNRLVLELDELRTLPSALIGELVRLYKRIQGSGGLMRLCGLNESNQDVLRMTRLDQCFPHYLTRADAVKGVRGDGEQ